MGFIGWHTWFQPRYYLVCVLPFAMVLAIGMGAVKSRAHQPGRNAWRVVRRVALFTVEIAAALMLVQTAGYLLHPKYTMLSAARSTAAIMKSDARHPQVLMASSADDIGLLTGVRSVNPEWPLGGLSALVRQTEPGWYAAYTPWDDKHIREVQALYRMHEAARFQVFDDPDCHILRRGASRAVRGQLPPLADHTSRLVLLRQPASSKPPRRSLGLGGSSMRS